MTARRRPRARGRAHPCACGEEKLRLTHRGPELRVDGWSYLVGECGGGVGLRFQGIKVVESREVDKAEIDRLRALPARRVQPHQAMLDALEERTRTRLDTIVVEIREAIHEGMQRWLAVGRLLAEAKRLLKKGDFGLWVEHNGMDRVHAAKLIAVHEMARAVPAFSQTFEKIGQEKTALLTRLPEAKRLEVLEAGVPVQGTPTPLERVTFRQLNAYVRSIVGRDPRGRKPRAEAAPAAKPKERFGLPIEMVEPLQEAMKGLHALRAPVKRELATLTPPQRLAFGRLWVQVMRLFYELHDDLGLGRLLDG